MQAGAHLDASRSREAFVGDLGAVVALEGETAGFGPWTLDLGL